MSAPIVLKSNIIVDIKTGIIKALRASFDNIEYPDKEVRDIAISMDYPLEQNSYPHVWVQFSFTKLVQAGIGHVFYEDNTIRHEFIFEGKVSLSIHALSSKSRDILASQLIQFLAFRELNVIAAGFDDYLQDLENVHMSINRDTLDLQGQSTTVGTPWNPEELSYEDGYSFQVIGQIVSTYQVTPAILREIDVTGTAHAGDDTETFEFIVDKNGVSPGQWH